MLRRVLLWAAFTVLFTTSNGCCRMWERWCDRPHPVLHPQHSAPVCCPAPPQCVPAAPQCCPPGYSYSSPQTSPVPPATGWRQP